MANPTQALAEATASLPVTLVLGGTRSGKSARGEQLALASGRKVYYVATYPRREDAAMSKRIARHRRERSPLVETIEHRWDLRALAAEFPGVCFLVDCLTLWLYVQMQEETSDEAIVETLAEALAATAGSVEWVIVSSELGLGVVPMGDESRRFVDLSGAAHQRLGGLASRVELMVAGLPLRVK